MESKTQTHDSSEQLQASSPGTWPVGTPASPPRGGELVWAAWPPRQGCLLLWCRAEHFQIQPRGDLLGEVRRKTVHMHSRTAKQKRLLGFKRVFWLAQRDRGSDRCPCSQQQWKGVAEAPRTLSYSKKNRLHSHRERVCPCVQAELRETAVP